MGTTTLLAKHLGIAAATQGINKAQPIDAKEVHYKRGEDMDKK